MFNRKTIHHPTNSPKEALVDIEVHFWIGRFGIHIMIPSKYQSKRFEFDSIPKKKTL